MAKSVFLSALTPAPMGGSIQIQFTKANVDTPPTFTITIALSQDDNEKTIARKIWAGLSTGFAANNARYSGYPTFRSDTQIPFTFEIIRTDHIISIWSQSDYDVEIIDNTTDAIIVLSSAPVFCTISNARRWAASSGVNLVSATGCKMNDELVAFSLIAASSKLVALMNGFNVIPSVYVQLESGEWFRGVNCRFAPVLKISPIMVRGPYGPGNFNSLQISTVQRIEVDEWSGYIQFLDWSNSIGLNEAGDFGNAIMWSYVAGHQFVSEALGQIAVQTVGMAKAPVEIAGFKGASFALEFRDPQKALPLLTSQLAQFSV